MPKINKVDSQWCRHPNSQIVPTARSSRQQPSLLKNNQGARQISQKTNHVLEWSSRPQTNIKDNDHVREQSSNIRPLYCWNGDVMILYWKGTVLEYLAGSPEWRQRWLAGFWCNGRMLLIYQMPLWNEVLFADFDGCGLCRNGRMLLWNGMLFGNGSCLGMIAEC